MYDAERLFLRLVESNGQQHDAQFDLAGSQDAIEAVAAACGWTTLSLSADDYRAIQTILNAGGFEVGTPDGQWGPASQSAMRAYQVSVGLPETGAPDRATLETLGVNQ
jgi:peptidoglycan hydrolase-like protein with peptidoglycan-binding domain